MKVASAFGLKPVSSILLRKGLTTNKRLEEASCGIEPRLLLMQALCLVMPNAYQADLKARMDLFGVGGFLFWGYLGLVVLGMFYCQRTSLF